MSPIAPGERLLSVSAARHADVPHSQRRAIRLRAARIESHAGPQQDLANAWRLVKASTLRLSLRFRPKLDQHRSCYSKGPPSLPGLLPR